MKLNSSNPTIAKEGNNAELSKSQCSRWHLLFYRRNTQAPTGSRQTRGELTFWQRRFWEHLIQDENDFRRHLDYIHFNPVKHGYTESVSEWPWSSFHRYVKQGAYPMDWGGIDQGEMDLSSMAE